MIFEDLIHVVILFLNSISVLILLMGVAKAIYKFIKAEIMLIGSDNRDELELEAINMIKRNLGSFVLLSLEILIAADIIESIINPTFDDLFKLAAVVVIRTVISYFLGKEIEATEHNH